jgi:Mg2+-importing ATPase
VKLSKQKVIVKHLDAIQNFGAMDILCTDKTGTLTQDKIVLENHTDISGKTSERVLHSAWLNSHYQTGLKNLLDVAVLEGVDEGGRPHALAAGRRWMRSRSTSSAAVSVVVSEQPDVHQLICKGRCRRSSTCRRRCAITATSCRWTTPCCAASNASPTT